ncbi:MAG: hypothetical protein R2726_11975 [Acidimicrobiales bacterium]
MADDTSDERSSGHRVRWWWIAGGAVLVVAVAVGVFFVLLATRETAPPSLDEALRRQGGTTGTTARPGGPARPAPGVYTATGSGTETLGIPSAPQSEGPTMPLAVSVDAQGCNLMRIDYNANHWQTWTYCPQPDGTIVEKGGQTFQRFDLVAIKPENLSTFVCDPPSPVLIPDAEPGRVIDQSCSGTSTGTQGSVTSAGPATYVGPEELTIGGTVVRVHRMHQERTLSGAQTGTEVAETWFTDEGLPVRNEKKTRVASPSPVGDITYVEEGSWQLDSLTPRSG